MTVSLGTVSVTIPVTVTARALRTLDMIVARGRIIDRPRPKRNARLDAGLDTLLA